MLANERRGGGSELGQAVEVVVDLNTPFMLRNYEACAAAEVEEAVMEAGEVCGTEAAPGPEAGVLELTVDESPELIEYERTVREVAKDLRQVVTEFLQDNLRERPRMGYTQSGATAVDIKGLKRELFYASQELEEMFTADEDQSPVAISMRTFAQNLQLSVDSFRVYLTRSSFIDGVSENYYGELMSVALNFKREVSAVIQETDAFMLRVQQAARAPRGQ